MSLNERGRSWSACAAVLILALLGSCAGQVEAVESDDVAVNAQAIQERYVVFSQTSTARWVNLLFSDSMTMLGKTVGVLHYTSRLGYRVSCGATFISPQFAVTASHCVSNAHLGPNSGTNPPTTPFNVTHVNTANLSSQALVNQLTVTGTWPNWTHTGLTEQNGYVTTTFPCTVHTACDTAFMRTGTCPLASSIQADIALVKCPTRKTNPTYKSAWTFVNTVDTGVQNVEVWWFHELYSLATQPGAATTCRCAPRTGRGSPECLTGRWGTSAARPGPMSPSAMGRRAPACSSAARATCSVPCSRQAARAPWSTAAFAKTWRPERRSGT